MDYSLMVQEIALLAILQRERSAATRERLEKLLAEIRRRQIEAREAA